MSLTSHAYTYRFAVVSRATVSAGVRPEKI